MKTFFLIVILLIKSYFFSLSQIKINEVMHLPVNKEPEWIELINYQNQYVDSINLVISDPNGHYSFKLQSIKPYQYIVLVKDTNLLKQFRNIPDTSQLIQTKIPSLNNTGDSLVLKLSSGMTIDSFYFGKDFGKSGISLERKDPNLPADNRENLVPSISLDSATCGKINSVSIKQNDTIDSYNEIDIQPNPFSPNSSKNRCKISIFSKEYIRNLSIKIYDTSGNLIKSLIETNYEDKFTQKQLEWDGTNNDNFIVQVGPYPLIIQYEVVSNNKKVTHKRIIVVGN